MTGQAVTKKWFVEINLSWYILKFIPQNVRAIHKDYLYKKAKKSELGNIVSNGL